MPLIYVAHAQWHFRWPASMLQDETGGGSHSGMATPGLPQNKLSNHQPKRVNAASQSFENVSSFPRNMHPQYYPGRRKARAATLLKMAAAMPDTVPFVDTAQYVNFKHFVAAVTSLQGEHLTSLTLPNTDADRTEQGERHLAREPI
ncbi:hypothetical protein HPB50_002528 [Hyalomma asiaticum]|uniref:Uncharacterized protein n=1 Tax=Hyalomma asiaticum TaxID=266040 RepID=A0ACB7TE03_HYAAI|nr:hypothetical protein HPB50_002528 [Hyalomma asiaticum]